jgi:ribosomal protein S18 acetylase RimI-like enzyme
MCGGCAGTKLLKHVLDLCEQDQSILDVYLHVQINNNEAIEFYRKFGFDITDTIRNYYKRIDPPHCHVLSKHLVPAGKPK